MSDALKAKIRAGTPVLGAFLKTPSHQAVEILCAGDQDFLVIDAEHAAFNLEALDRLAAAARRPLLLRPPSLDADLIRLCLDMGFAGVMAPHVRGAADVDALLDVMRYGRGRRGFSPSTRAAGYGVNAGTDYRRGADARTLLFCQIEDLDALDAIDRLAERDEVDCLFVGRADLAASLGVDRTDDPLVAGALEVILASGARHGRAVGLYLIDPEEIAAWRRAGASVFVCGSDQSFILAGARRSRSRFDAAVAADP